MHPEQRATEKISSFSTAIHLLNMKESDLVKATRPIGQDSANLAPVTRVGYRRIGNNQCQSGESVSQLFSPKSRSSVGIASAHRLKMNADDVSKKANDNLRNVLYDKEKVTSPMMQPKFNTDRSKSKDPFNISMSELVRPSSIKNWSPSKSLPAKAFEKSIRYLNLVGDDDDHDDELLPLEQNISNKVSDMTCEINTVERPNSLGNIGEDSDAFSLSIGGRNPRTRANRLCMSMSSISPHAIESNFDSDVRVTGTSHLKENLFLAASSTIQRPTESSTQKIGATTGKGKIRNGTYTYVTASAVLISPAKKAVARQIKTINGKIVFVENDNKSPVKAVTLSPTNDAASTTTQEAAKNTSNALPSDIATIPVRTYGSNKYTIMNETTQSPSKLSISPSKAGSPSNRRAKSWKPTASVSPIFTKSTVPRDVEKRKVITNTELHYGKVFASDGKFNEPHSKGAVDFKKSKNGEDVRCNKFTNSSDEIALSTENYDFTNKELSPTKDGCKSLFDSVDKSIQQVSSPSQIYKSPNRERAKSWKPATKISPSAAPSPVIFQKIRTFNGKIFRDSVAISPQKAVPTDKSKNIASMQGAIAPSSFSSYDIASNDSLGGNHQKAKSNETKQKLLEGEITKPLKVEQSAKNESVDDTTRGNVCLSSYFAKKKLQQAEKSSAASSFPSKAVEQSIDCKLIQTPKRTKDSLLLFQQDSVHVHNQRSPPRKSLLAPNNQQSSSDISDCDSFSAASSFDSDDNIIIKSDFLAFQRKSLSFDPSIPSPYRRKKTTQRAVLNSDIYLPQDDKQEVEEDFFAVLLDNSEENDDTTRCLAVERKNGSQSKGLLSKKEAVMKVNNDDKSAHSSRSDKMLDRATMHEVSVSSKSKKVPDVRRSVIRCPTGMQDIVKIDVSSKRESAVIVTAKDAKRTQSVLSTRESLLKHKANLKAKGELKLSMCEDKNQTWEVMHWSDFEANEMCNLWLTKSDFTAMKAEYESILYLIASNKPIDEDNHSSRGLEKRTEDGAWELYECLRDARNAVLDIQDDQRRKKKFCQLEIAKVYIDVTTKAREEAIKKARQDAKEIKPYLKIMMGKLSNKPNCASTELKLKSRSVENSPNRKNLAAPKRVCFSDNETICEIPNLKSISKEEHGMVWFTPKEIEDILLECQEVLKVMEAKEEKNLSSTLASRGLENRTVDGKLKLHSRQRLAWDIVLSTQKCQRQINIFDPLEIASVYNEATAKSLKKAMKRAKSDFKASR